MFKYEDMYARFIVLFLMLLVPSAFIWIGVGYLCYELKLLPVVPPQYLVGGWFFSALLAAFLGKNNKLFRKLMWWK